MPGVLHSDLEMENRREFLVNRGQFPLGGPFSHSAVLRSDPVR
jgi:hypothetical protein